MRVILDTDMGNDIDDALALVMLHEMERRDECELLGVTVCKDNPWATAYTRLVNARCGKPEIPVGIVRKGPTPEYGNFIRQITEGQGGVPVESEEEATILLRRLLAAQPDHSVVLITIGFFTNVSRLLDSASDEISSLSGLELFARKVRLVVAMAGNFRPDVSGGPDVGNPEFNVRTDIPAAQNFISRCPCPLIFSGFEIGMSVMFPGSVIEDLLLNDPGNPVARGYEAYLPMPYDRPCWDQTAVLYAIRSEKKYFTLSTAGVVEVDDEGYTQFTPSDGGKHRYLIFDPKELPRIQDDILELSTTFPDAHAGATAAEGAIYG